MLSTAITFNPTIAISVCHKGSFTHPVVIHIFTLILSSDFKVYLDYRHELKASTINPDTATALICLR
jgi:hypothetical protein